MIQVVNAHLIFSTSIVFLFLQGGSLKTLAQRDGESLQARWCDMQLLKSKQQEFVLRYIGLKMSSFSDSAKTASKWLPHSAWCTNYDSLHINYCTQLSKPYAVRLLLSMMFAYRSRDILDIIQIAARYRTSDIAIRHPVLLPCSVAHQKLLLRVVISHTLEWVNNNKFSVASPKLQLCYHTKSS